MSGYAGKASVTARNGPPASVVCHQRPIADYHSRRVEDPASNMSIRRPRSILASPQRRIFLIAWILYSLHFATNIVREHYPAFSLVDHGTFLVDEYQGFHPDIFAHNGHSVIGNQVLVSVLAAVPLLIFDPALDRLEAYSKQQLATQGAGNTEYRIGKPTYQAFFRLVKERGLDLRFGGTAVVTTVFFMAPLTALFLTYFYGILRGRGVAPQPAAVLTFLLGFGSPLFYRATVLGHNMFVMFAMFISFGLLWLRPGDEGPLSLRRRLLAGFFAGLTLATDYMGVVIMPLLFAYLVLPRLRTATWRVSIRESMAMVAGSLPPVAFLLYSQWVMYGNPFLPGQYWMPNQNEYVQEGMRGFTMIDAELFLQNLFHPGFGLYVWAPITLLALIPTWRYRAESLVLPRQERRFVAAAAVVLMLFCATNQYARLQWNSGLRYLLPLVPFFFLALTDHWLRLSRSTRIAIGTVALVQAWVLTVYREPAVRAWQLFFEEGPRLPWYRVLSLTSSPGSPWLNTWWIPTALLFVALALVAGIWRYGAAEEARQLDTHPGMRGSSGR